MLQHPLIVFATYAEAAPTLKALAAAELTPDRYYRSELADIVITGMGALAAAAAIGRYGQNASCMINVGIAGALIPDVTLGQAVSVSQVMRNPILPDNLDPYSQDFHRSLFPILPIAEEGVRLITSDYPIHHPELSRHLRQHGDIVDMEGYGVALAAQQLGIPCQIDKVVSDFTNLEGPRMIREQIDRLAVTCWHVLERYLQRCVSH